MRALLLVFMGVLIAPFSEAVRERSSSVAPAIDKKIQTDLEKKRVTKKFVDAYVKSGEAMESVKQQEQVVKGAADMQLKRDEMKVFGDLVKKQANATQELNEAHADYLSMQKNPRDTFKEKWFMQDHSTVPGAKVPGTKVSSSTPEKKSLLDKIKDKIGGKK